MKIHTFLSIYAGVTVFWGVSWLLFSGLLFALYGLQESAALKYTGQLFGAALIGLAVIAWSVRITPASEARRAIILALFITEVLCFIVALIGQLDGVVNALGWTTVAICLLFAIGFGYYHFFERDNEVFAPSK